VTRKKMLFHQDNAPSHKSIIAMTKLYISNGCFVSSSEMTHLQSLDDNDKYHDMYFYKSLQHFNKIYYNFLFLRYSLCQNMIQSDVFTVRTIAPTGRCVVELFTELGNKVRTALDVRVCSNRLIIFVIGVWKPSQLSNSEHLILPYQSNLKLVLIDIFPPTIYEITTSICYFAFHKSPSQKNGTLAILYQILVDKTICKEELHTCIVYVLASTLCPALNAIKQRTFPRVSNKYMSNS
ncbi:hypothetical protein ALC53_00087, partial [Atta colombica]